LREGSISHRVCNGLKKAMNVRKKQRAFHPLSHQEILATDRSFVAFKRCHEETGDTVFCVSNITGQLKELETSHFTEEKKALLDLIEGQEVTISQGKIYLHAYQTVWLKTLQHV
jgi:hypothetical protein